jgi:hypothetical protein
MWRIRHLLFQNRRLAQSLAQLSTPLRNYGDVSGSTVGRTSVWSAPGLLTRHFADAHGWRGEDAPSGPGDPPYRNTSPKLGMWVLS